MKIYFVMMLVVIGGLVHAQPEVLPPTSTPISCKGNNFYKTYEIGLTVTPGFFRDVSPENPYYVRIVFEPNFYGLKFHKTWVDLGGPPIYLSAYLPDPPEPGVSLSIPPDAIPIIRWRENETTIWIKVTSPSCDWVMKNGESLGCQDDTRIAFKLGVSALQSETLHGPLFEMDHASRASNSRADGVPVDTTILLDVRGYDTESFYDITRSPKALPYTTDWQTTGVETEENEEDIVLGGSPFANYGYNIPLFNVEDCTENLYPWVSYNDQFNSIVVANYYGSEPAVLEFTATRQDGTSYFTSRELPPRGFLAERPVSLFPDLEKGAGFSVLMRALPDAKGRWVTFNSGTQTGRSPSQGTAARLNDPGSITAPEPQPGDPNALLFGYLPLSDGFSSAPVVVNAGALPVDVSLFFYDVAGNLILRDDDLIKQLRGYQPFAVPTAAFLPGYEGDVQMIAYSEDGPIQGAAFVFNTALEPAIGNAQPIHFDPEAIAAPKKPAP